MNPYTVYKNQSVETCESIFLVVQGCITHFAATSGQNCNNTPTDIHRPNILVAPYKGARLACKRKIAYLHIKLKNDGAMFMATW